MGSKGSAPTPPDYEALIPLQEAAYNRSFNRMLGASRVNSLTPYGTTRWIRPGPAGRLPPPSANPTAPAPPDDRRFRADAGSDSGLNTSTGELSVIGPEQPLPASRAPTARYNPALDVGDFGEPWTFIQELSPEQQALYEQDLAIRRKMGDIAQQMMGPISDIYGKPVDFASQLPSYVYREAPSYTPQEWRGPEYRTDVGSREDAERAILNRQLRYDLPLMERRRNQAQDRLLAMGANVADERYRNAMGDLYDVENRYLADAIDRAILGGGREATEELQRGLAAEGARFGAGQSEGQFGWQAGMQGQQFGAQQQLAALNYALQQIGQRRLDRATPLNELSAFRTGNQVQLPGTPGQFSVPGLQTPDLLGAARSTYEGQLGAYSAEQASADNFMKGLFGLAGAAVGAPWFPAAVGAIGGLGRR